jgi:hypothetical protein
MLIICNSPLKRVKTRRGSHNSKVTKLFTDELHVLEYSIPCAAWQFAGVLAVFEPRLLSDESQLWMKLQSIVIRSMPCTRGL